MRSENVESAEETIRNFILEFVSIGELDNDLDIFESGLLNSLFAIELMTFLEKAFAIKVTMDDLDMENFKSINAMCRFLKGKKLGEVLRVEVS